MPDRSTVRAPSVSAVSTTPSRAVNQKLEPCPGMLSTPMRPSIISTSRLAIARPSPVPPYCRVVDPSPWTNDSKIFSRTCGFTPMPVSRTSKRTNAVWAEDSRTLTWRTTSPSGVNLTALLIRLVRI